MLLFGSGRLRPDQPVKSSSSPALSSVVPTAWASPESRSALDALPGYRVLTRRCTWRSPRPCLQ